MHVNDTYYVNDKNQKLACSFYFPEKFDPTRKYETVPVGHGMGGSKDSHYIMPSIMRIVESDRIGFSFNMRGANRDHPDTRDLTPENGKKDIQYAMEFLADQPFVDKKKIMPIMASYSGNLITQYAADANSVEFAGIVSHATAVRPTRKFENKLKKYGGVYRRLWAWKGHYPVPIDGKKCLLPYGIYSYFSQYDLVRDAAPNVKCPIVFVHGTKDDLAPVQDVRELAQAMKQSPLVQLHEIEDAPHNMRDSEQGNFLTQAIEFSRQAIELFSTGNFGKIVDVNGNPYDQSGDSPQLKYA